MLRRLGRRRSLWIALAAGIVAAPSLLGGVAAAPSDSVSLLDPLNEGFEPAPPDPAEAALAMARAKARLIADLAPEQYRLLVALAAERHRLDPRLLAAIITVETDWHADAIGAHGEKGLMQILPATGLFLAEWAGLVEYDLADSETSLHLGALYLARLLDKYGTAEKALAAYNGGPGAVRYWETHPYVRQVMRYYRLRERTPDERLLPVLHAS